MTQVSKRFLQKQVEDRIINLLSTSLTSISNKAKLNIFLDDLLTPTEKLMIGKRLAIAFMLRKGYDYPTINSILKVTDTTIWNIKTTLHHRGKGYIAVLDDIIQQEKWAKLWENIDHFITKSMPPRSGTNWKEVRRKQWEKRRSQQKPF